MCLFVRLYRRRVAACDPLRFVRSFDRSRRTFEALVQHYNIRFASAADLGFGTGSFATYLARHWGVPVFGVDASPEILSIVRNRCGDPDVRWLRQDLRCFQLPSRVDLITANFDTLNRLIAPTGFVHTLSRIRDSLHPRGWFLFDFAPSCEPPGRHRQLCQCPTIDRLVKRPYSPTEIGAALSRAGFIIRGVHPPESSHSAGRCLPRLFVVAQPRS